MIGTWIEGAGERERERSLHLMSVHIFVYSIYTHSVYIHIHLPAEFVLPPFLQDCRLPVVTKCNLTPKLQYIG